MIRSIEFITLPRMRYTDQVYLLPGCNFVRHKRINDSSRLMGHHELREKNLGKAAFEDKRSELITQKPGKLFIKGDSENNCRKADIFKGFFLSQFQLLSVWNCISYPLMSSKWIYHISFFIPPAKRVTSTEEDSSIAKVVCGVADSELIICPFFS